MTTPLSGASPFASRANYHQYLNGIPGFGKIIRRIEGDSSLGHCMGIHGGAWRVHASAVDDIEIIAEAMLWLAGSESEISINHSKSAHGSPMVSIISTMKKKVAVASLCKFGEEQIFTIIDEDLAARIDEDKVLHIRASLSKLVSGEASLECERNGPVVKGTFKLEVYPNEDVFSVAEKFLRDLIDSH